MSAATNFSEQAGRAAMPACWLEVLQAEFDKPYMVALRQFLRDEKMAGKAIYPPGEEIFSAFTSVPFEQVKVVILGQDPYHGPGQAHGLAFSVKPGIPTPPSLQNIYKEIYADLGVMPPSHGNLQSWAEQGVLLLNATLSVERGKAGSHQRKGWEQFTDVVVEALNTRREGLVFMLWGSYAQKKGAAIDRERHLVLESPHPSPLSAHRGFFGSGHFSRANQWLEARGNVPVDWSVPDPDSLF